MKQLFIVCKNVSEFRKLTDCLWLIDTIGVLLWNNPFVLCEICLCDQFNKEDHWPIAKQDKVQPN